MVSSNRSLNVAKTAMRLVIVAAVLLASTSLAVGAGTACSKEGKAFAVLMDSAPEGTGRLTYWAIGDLNEDEDLWVVYDRFKESSDAGQLKEVVQVLDVVKDSARVVGSDNAAVSKAPVTVLRAKFDRKYVEDQLNTLKYTRSAYRDVNIWVAGDGQAYRPVALMSGIILMGDVSDLKACIDARKSKEGSLRDDPKVKGLMGRLPNGVVVEVDTVTPASSEGYADLVAYGKSYTKAKKDTLKLTAVYLFVDEPAASTAQLAVVDHLSATFEGVKVKRDGNLLIATSQILISKFAESLQF
jgi:hypothetical protein